MSRGVRRKIEPLLNNERFLIDTEEKATEYKNKQIKTKDGFSSGPWNHSLQYNVFLIV